MSVIDDDALLDARQAACFTRIAVSTLAKLRCVGGSPAYIKAGRKILYRRRDLVAWLDARRVANTMQARSMPRRLTDPLE
jgi:hypothetical protein